MAIKKTAEIGSEVIRSRAKEVDKINSSKVKKIIKDLTDSMRHENLVGMAAPQIGIRSRIFITEVRKTMFRKNISELDTLRVFVNPKITKTSKKLAVGYEGCGSVASGGLFGNVKRPETISVRAFNETGEEFELETSGLLARIIQHEMDHLNGICFIDKITDTKTLLGKQEYIKRGKKIK
jgi:peptide deformylase